ncbi:MAG: lipid IV(A) 3-deoxy-D-manno-octulosonic acid transferase [Gammaproteobacteria bacterium]|nr:lipid IV(A) 3-deoxy-D-manno-octulosonic acid transferase [Gammaproteobacteria bacterium]
MWRTIYQVLLILAYPVVRLRLLWRARREPDYGRRIAERFGHVPEGVPLNPVWFHTVSAGETIAAAPVIRKLAEEFPELQFLVTTMTPTGSAQVRTLLGDHVAHCYAPYDFSWGVRRFYAAVAPKLLVLMETELWPNLINVAHEREVPAVLVNARLSERSARGYARIGSLTRTMLEQLSFIACQYPDHAERFLALGAAASRVSAPGSIKFDVQLPADHADRVAELRSAWGLAGRPVWIAGSTHPGEEEIILAAHRTVRGACPDACLLLVPRHPARADEVERLTREAGFQVVRQSELSSFSSEAGAPEVVLADTMGQLLYLYGLSDVAFLGGSLVSVGGHNPIEAAICAQPLIMGPETFNFPDVVAAFSDAGCLFLVRDAEQLASRVTSWLADNGLRADLGQAAHRVVTENTGATGRLLDLLRAEIRSATAGR